MFADRLKTILKECEVTPYRLSKLTGVSQGAISKYLNNLRQPTFDIVCRFADALNVSVNYFKDDSEVDYNALLPLFWPDGHTNQMTLSVPYRFKNMPELLTKIEEAKRRENRK